MTKSPSLTVGTRPFGLSRRYSGSRLPPNGPPRSSRSNGRSNSAQHHSTFCTLDELARPQIFSIAIFLSHRGGGNGASVLPRTQPPPPRKPVYLRASVAAAGSRMNRLAFAVALLGLLVSAAGQASQPRNQTVKNVKLMDRFA